MKSNILICSVSALTLVFSLSCGSSRDPYDTQYQWRDRSRSNAVVESNELTKEPLFRIRDGYRYRYAMLVALKDPQDGETISRTVSAKLVERLRDSRSYDLYDSRESRYYYENYDNEREMTLDIVQGQLTRKRYENYKKFFGTQAKREPLQSTPEKFRFTEIVTPEIFAGLYRIEIEFVTNKGRTLFITDVLDIHSDIENDRYNQDDDFNFF